MKNWRIGGWFYKVILMLSQTWYDMIIIIKWQITCGENNFSNHAIFSICHIHDLGVNNHHSRWTIQVGIGSNSIQITWTLISTNEFTNLGFKKKKKEKQEKKRDLKILFFETKERGAWGGVGWKKLLKEKNEDKKNK